MADVNISSMNREECLDPLDLNLCGFCMSQTGVPRQDIKNCHALKGKTERLEMLEKIFKSLSISILNENIPNRICELCENQLLTMILFLEICQKSEKRQRQTTSVCTMGQSYDPIGSQGSAKLVDDSSELNVTMKEEVQEDVQMEIFLSPKQEDIEESDIEYGNTPGEVYWHIESPEGDPEDSPSELQIDIPESLLSMTDLTDKTFNRYLRVYNEYKEWALEKNTTETTEQNLLLYFKELEEKQKLKATSLFARYSMIRSCVLNKEHLDISTYALLRRFLKGKQNNHEPKKTKLLTTEEMIKFINDAPDSIYLLEKVAAIFGIFGGLRRSEIHAIKIGDLVDYDTSVLVNIPATNDRKKPKSFFIEGQFFQLYQKYRELRPMDVPTRRFFIAYQKGKCTKTPLGIGKIGNIPKTIAKYLKLPDPNMYTAQCFRELFIMMKKGKCDPLVSTKVRY